MFKVTAHVFANNEVDEKSEKVGTVTFTTHRHDAGLHVANNIDLPADCFANVDFEVAIHLGRKRVWVDANRRSLERAAEQLMQLSNDIQQAGMKLRAAE